MPQDLERAACHKVTVSNGEIDHAQTYFNISGDIHELGVGLTQLILRPILHTQLP